MNPAGPQGSPELGQGLSPETTFLSAATKENARSCTRSATRFIISAFNGSASLMFKLWAENVPQLCLSARVWQGKLTARLCSNPSCPGTFWGTVSSTRAEGCDVFLKLSVYSTVNASSANADWTAFHLYIQPLVTAGSIFVPHHSALGPPLPCGNTRGCRLAWANRDPPAPRRSCPTPQQRFGSARSPEARPWQRQILRPLSFFEYEARPIARGCTVLPPLHQRISARLHHPGEAPGRAALSAPLQPPPAAPAGPPPAPRVPPSSRCRSGRKRKRQRQSGSGNADVRDSAPERRGGRRG